MSFVEAVARLETATIGPSATIADALRRLEVAGTGALLVCDTDGRLCGLLTDGDIRRAILGNIPLTDPCGTIASPQPLCGRPDLSSAQALQLMDTGRDFVVNQLPLVDDRGMAAGLLLRSDLATQERLGMSAVIMAGGFGTRLLPLTERTPKPLLPVGDRPLLDRTINQMRRSGIRHVVVSTHYLADQITNHLGTGQAHGVDITYLSEDRPLGTAGALRLLGQRAEPVLVINGDILTGMRYEEMLAYHREQAAEVTIGVRQCDLEVPYGVLECEGAAVRAIREKPHMNFLINAGVYLLEPSVHQDIPEDRRFDMTDLIQRLLDQGRKVACFPIVEYWLDIGQPADYAQAQADVKIARLA
ncbi:MAG TPA: nucleotidyltransferase family protein [Gemmatimonadales bacterium]|jgi:dTDP-glucose pyrophosphorylase